MSLEIKFSKFGRLAPHVVEIAILNLITGVRPIAVYLSKKVGEPVGPASVHQILKHIRVGKICISHQMMLDEVATHPEGKLLRPFVEAQIKKESQLAQIPPPAQAEVPTPPIKVTVADLLRPYVDKPSSQDKLSQ